jgi:hypothetical protein
MAMAFGITGFSGPLVAQENLDQAIQDLRDEFSRRLGPDRLGGAYASIINFAVNPDISAATYYVDAGDLDASDPELNVFRLPLRHVFELDSRGWRPFVEANLAYQSYQFDFAAFDTERVDTEWQTYGGTLTGGVEIAASEQLTLVPAVTLGLVHLENDANYTGPRSNLLLQPALEGLVFDWDADAWLVGASLAADYRRGLRNFELSIHGSLTHNYIETYDSSSGLIEFDSQATTFALQAETIHPTTMTAWGYPLALVASLGNTTFIGSDRDALGFEYFFEAGLALEADVSSKEWPVKKLRLGASAIYGPDVKGWSLILGYRFL